MALNWNRNFSLPLLLRNILGQNGNPTPQACELVSAGLKLSAEESEWGNSPGVLTALQSNTDSL